MSALEIIQHGDAFVVSSETVAEGSGVQHKNVLELIDANRTDFEDFGQVAFETRKGSALRQGGFARSTRVALLNEQQATLLMTYQRNTDQVRAFKRALVKAFFEMARQAPAITSRRDLALAVLAAEDEADRQRSRADVAEEFKAAIELNDGLTVRDFHKKYFSDHNESQINEFFYDRGLLLDERNKRWDERAQKKKDGKNHRRPTYRGKPFFYLHGELDRDKIRREHTRVRPGEPELALVEYMTKRGFTANQSEFKGIAA